MSIRLKDSECVILTAKILNNQNSVKILKELHEKERRWVELEKVTGSKGGALSNQIRTLKNEGLIKKQEGFYFITEKGKEMLLRINNLNKSSIEIQGI